MEVVATYHLYLSSQYRTSGTTSNYTINLGKPIVLQNPNNRFTVRVGSAEIPYVFKLINPSNSTISYTIQRGSTQSGTFTLSTGNYTILTLLTELKTKLFTSIQTLTGWNATALASFVYDRTTGRVSLSLTGADGVGTVITVGTGSPVFLRCLGFSDAFAFGHTGTLPIVAVSTQNVNVSQNTAVYIRSDTLAQSHSYEAIVGTNGLTDIIAKVPITSNPQTYIHWTNMVDLENEINNRLIDSINLYLGDAQSQELDLGGLDWTCRLTVKEWATSGKESDDLARNMGGDTQLPQLLIERQKALDKLMRLRSKLSGSLVVDAPQAEAEAAPEADTAANRRSQRRSA